MKGISAMTTYDVYFRSDLQWGMREFVADTPAKALELAQQIAHENPDSVLLGYYDACDAPINEIEVCDDQGRPLATWYDEDVRLRIGAPDLLIAAQKILDRWQNGDIGEVIHELAIAVDAAKRGAP
jgi:hypothetical protein